MRLVIRSGLVLLTLWLPLSLAAAPGDDLFLSAREAAQRNDQARLAQLAPLLQSHPLSPYVELWQLRPRLAELPEAEVRSYLTRHEGQLPGNRLRADWLRTLGRRQMWDAFDRDWGGLVDPDQDLQCLRIQASYGRDPKSLVAQRGLWFSGRDLPEACTMVFDTMFASGVLKEADAWERLRLALQSNNASLARAVGQRLAGWTPASSKLLDTAASHPGKYLGSPKLALHSRAHREIALFALGRIAAETPDRAADLWDGLGHRFSRDDREFGWSQIAVVGARKHSPQALAWFRKAGDARLDDTQLEWRARAGLRAKAWPDLLKSFDAMSAEARERPVWRFWRARALKETGREADAMPLLAALAGEHHFHAQLAQEALGPSVGPAPVSYKPTEDEVTAAAGTPGLRRALAFYRLGLRYEGNLEWIWTVRDMDDVRLLAAAELARREGWWERAINTAEKTRTLTNMDLRYPTPYENLLRTRAREFDVDEAWVYGVVRQESRFNASARSSVGASGLMQVMPATAKWIAGKLGIKGWQQGTETDPDVNVNFGTFYLKEMLVRLDGSPVLASAAYNAGPGRAQNWRGPVPLEGAIYIDTIPFTETRDYVRKVMANTAQYARQFGRQLESLTQRLGVVQPRAGG